MNTVIIVCVIVVTLAVVVAVAFLVQTLSQVKRTAHEAEILLKSVNQEMSAIGRITGSISALVDRLTSPWMRAGSWFAGIASTLFRKGHKERQAASEGEKEKVRI